MQCNAKVNICLVVVGAGLGKMQAVTAARRVRATRKRKMKVHLVPGMAQSPVTVSFLDSSSPSQS